MYLKLYLREFAACVAQRFKCAGARVREDVVQARLSQRR